MGSLRWFFDGKVADKLIGIYRVPYQGDYIVTTQFEPTGARHFIPCLDKPWAKARFKLRIRVDGDYDVIFNTPPERVYWDGQ
ncbi:hypothetical protein [Vulcanisaeta thermophila]|uniref:hypothetical protein n=1 Tax=Vulcanisaeta thermophila TaxID=867917 RepID=UPI0008539BE5|nr:hypothetical protein [Vulcanisaeta thermophila]